MRPLRYLWASPTTCVGLLVAAFTLVTGGRVVRHTGVLEVCGGFASWALRTLVPLPNGASAMTLGHVVIGRGPAALARTRRHERVHVAQCERWGPLFIPAYFVASGIAWWRGEPIYRGNRFEREAFAIAP